MVLQVGASVECGRPVCVLRPEHEAVVEISKGHGGHKRGASLELECFRLACEYVTSEVEGGVQRVEVPSARV